MDYACVWVKNRYTREILNAGGFLFETYATNAALSTNRVSNSDNE